MKTTGIVRRIDQLGRIVLPMELRKTLDFKEGTPVEICVENDKVILKKYHCSCIICGNKENLKRYKDKTICSDCIEQLKLV